MNISRIRNAVEIINYAIKNNISVKDACVKCGYSDTYVKNIKALVYENYENGTLEDEDFNLFNEAYSKYIDKLTPIDNINLNNLKDIRGAKVKEWKDKGLLENSGKEIKVKVPDDEKIKFDVKGNTGEITWNTGSNYPVNHVKTLDQLLKICEVDLNLWKVKDYTVNKWDVTSWKNETPQTLQNFQVKARLEKNVVYEETKSQADIFLDLIKNYQPPLIEGFYCNTTVGNENNLLEISIFDLHLGKLAWGGETGENYDTKIARERFMYSIETLLKRASGFQYSRILFPVGSDFLNSDTILNTTTKGTFQDEDLRWKKTFKVAIELLVDAINLMKLKGVPIDVIIIPGNHDLERNYYIGSVLEAWFRNDNMVNVDNSAPERKFYKFGKVLLGFTHGSEEKESALPLIMATDCHSKKYWSETVFHEWHLGHIHRKKTVKYNVTDNKDRTLKEDLGVTIRYLSSLTGTEEWHYRKGFIGAIKAADAFIWNNELGLIAELTSNLNIEG
jgi:hypothetical protein